MLARLIETEMLRDGGKYLLAAHWVWGGLNKGTMDSFHTSVWDNSAPQALTLKPDNSVPHSMTLMTFELLLQS